MTGSRRELPLAVLVGLATVLLALRMGVSLFVEPMGDEAYYWVWGQHFGWSYYDHPPLQAWLQGAVSALLGPSTFTLRLPGTLTLIGTLYVLYLFVRRSHGENWQRWFLVAGIVLLGSPLFFIYTTIVTPDHLLVFLGVTSVYLLARFFETYEVGLPRWRFLFGAAVAIGLACLTKYVGIVLVIGLALAILVSPVRRRLLIDWRLYAAGLVTVAIQAPVLIWNIETNFASFRLHLVDRQQADFGFTVWHLVSFLIQLLVLTGPFLIWPIIRVYLARDRNFEGATQSIARATHAGSIGGFSLVALGNFVSAHWSILGQAAMVPALVRQIGAGWQLVAHALYGIAVGALLLTNYTVSPIIGVDNLETYRAYGWQEAAAAYDEELAKAQPDFLAASHYMLASQLNLARKSVAVTALSQRLDQYDYWFDDAAHLGQTALILDDTHSPLELIIADSFASVTELRRVQIVRQGVVINTYRIYLAAGYNGAPPGSARYQL